ncbi:MAG: prolipoprotein diacylglyceryl transferase [Candidatus Latescibacterota bacterium]
MCPYVAHIGPFTIASFGLMVALGFLAGLYVVQRELQRQGVDPEVGSAMITAAMLGGLVGAKLYYVAFGTPAGMSWARALRTLFSGAGLTWYGGFLAATAGVLWVVRRRGVPLGIAADAAAPAVVLGQALGRIGCQLAGDGDYGRPTDLPWGMAYPDGVVPTLAKVHPTPVYEALAYLLVFGVLWAVRRRVRAPGLVFCLYLVLAGTTRFLVEFIRINPTVLWGLTDAQLLSLAAVAVGLTVGAAKLRRGPRPAPATPLHR